MATKKITKAEKIAKTPFEDIARLKGEEGRKKLIKDITALRSAYKRRVGSFKRRDLISQAQIAFERDLPPGKPVPLTKLSRNQLIFEFFRYAQFFNSETSSAEGIIRVNREQDKRVFGVDVKGKPRKTMSSAERVLFWDTYEEYKHQFPADTNQIYSSESIQQQIAELIFNPDNISSFGLVDILSQVRQQLEQKKAQEDMSDVPNVFTGGRNPFDW